MHLWLLPWRTPSRANRNLKITLALAVAMVQLCLATNPSVSAVKHQAWHVQEANITEPGRVLVDGLSSPRAITLLDDETLLLVDTGSPAEPYSGTIQRMAVSGATTNLYERISNYVATDQSFPVEHIHGASDVTILDGRVFFILGEGSWTEVPLRGPNQLLRINSPTAVDTVFDLGYFEGLHNPDHLSAESNATGVTIAKDNSLWVSDAAGNWVAKVGEGNDADVVTVFPPVDGEDAVPTGMTPGPENSIYVALFRCASPSSGKGGVAQVYQDGSYRVKISGLSNPIDVAVDQFDTLYVLEYSVDFASYSGKISRISSDGVPELVIDQLNNPTSLAVGTRGIYVTEMASPAGGEAGTGSLRLFAWTR